MAEPLVRVGLADFNEIPATAEEAENALRIVTIEEFIAVDEPGAGAIVGEPDDALITQDGNTMMYGDGGAGKTTLSVDLALHLAAGDDWLGIPIERPVRVLIAENEGPRSPFRKKLERKCASWTGSPIEDRIVIVENPWASMDLDEDDRRLALSLAINKYEVDVVMIGPVTASGMKEAGTLQDVRAFDHLLSEVRQVSGRRVSFFLVHHENKGGKVSGAWEGCCDTLLHVQGQGHGHTRLFVQKARWASTYHATSFTLSWADGEGFKLEDKPEIDDSSMAEMILDVVRQEPGITWTGVEKTTKGMSKDRRRQVRDGLFSSGRLVNIVKRDGRDLWITSCPERTQSHLYVADDPVIRHLRPDPGAGGAQTEPAWGAHDQLPLRPAPRPIGAQGEGRSSGHPDEEGFERPPPDESSYLGEDI